MRRLVCFVLLVAPVCQASGSCPWLNSATAGGVLGGTVSGAVTHRATNKADVNCEFARQEGAATYVMNIDVVTMNNVEVDFAAFVAQCGKHSSPLRGIGNVAVACSYKNHHWKRSEQVISRVRERALLVRVSTTDKAATAAVLREEARSTAEQVAGNLF